jgi:large subunit ribosomal protein L7/L12
LNWTGRKEQTMASVEEIFGQINELKPMEIAELIKKMEDEWGGSAAPAAVAVAAPGAGGGEAAAEEQTEFDVILTSVGDKKIQVIKEVRAITGLGLKEAKEVVESAPKAIKEGVDKDEAAKIKEQIEAAGGQADIK